MDNANAFNNNTANKNGQLSSNYVFLKNNNNPSDSHITNNQLHCSGHFYYGGGNRSTRRKPLPCRKSLTNLIT